jgi:pseudouridine kinase
MAMTDQGFIVCGGCHIDRQLRLTAPPQPGRTNPARARERLGGVATNIACQLAEWGASVRFVGVQPPDSLAVMEARLADAGIEPRLAPLDGEPPGYTALLAPDGELLMGAAAMALYETVTPPLIRPGLANRPGPLILDANFPADTISSIVAACATPQKIFAAGTSIAKVARLTAALPRLDALVLNRGEAAALLGDEMSVDRMALALAADMRDGGVVLVSDGAALAALAWRGEVSAMQPPQISLVNANGAGDVMAARLFCDLDRRPDMVPAARLDAALAAGADYAAGTKAKV